MTLVMSVDLLHHMRWMTSSSTLSSMLGCRTSVKETRHKKLLLKDEIDNNKMQGRKRNDHPIL